jgi:hypothetical protein
MCFKSLECTKYNIVFIYRNDKSKFENVLKNLMNEVIQMNTMYINSQVNLLKLHLKLNLILIFMDV